MTFDEFFTKATCDDNVPYPFQRRFAEAKELYQLVDVPTGLGKTAMVVLGWLWRRFHAPDQIRKATPRRLVYCLPMRVLVEQTKENAGKWVENLRKAGCIEKDVPVHVLMGGEDQTDWAMWPACEMILIGTQDMLLSRALNRGYAASRARWPMEFGLLHNDCLWVFDEIQLMGPGLATTTQLEAFRRLPSSEAGHGCRSVWMSATLQRDWLDTVDFDLTQLREPLRLTYDDFDDRRVNALWQANKPLQSTKTGINNLGDLANEIVKAHMPGTRTIVVVNTVRRACNLCDEIAEHWGSTNGQRLVLLHSRFRPEDRKAQIDKALADPPPEGTIIVSTQVVEAGVDLSATTLFTELAPWVSLVQRCGRCNRRGEANKCSGVYWIDLPDEEAFRQSHSEKIKDKDGKPKSAKQIAEAYQEHLHSLARPYGLDDLQTSAARLKGVADVGLKSLPCVDFGFEHTHVIRRKDLIDLFDTTPDLAGNDIDIDRFIRDMEETDVRVFWRTWDQPHENDPPPNDLPAPQRAELCPAPIGTKASPGFRQFAEKHKGRVWRWDFLRRRWDEADRARIAPGQVYLIHADAGGYSPDRGWDPESGDLVDTLATPDLPAPPDANEEDLYARTRVWKTISEHTEEVCKQLNAILHEAPIDSADALEHAGRWHDRGKAHEVFVKALPDGRPARGDYWAKAPGMWKRYERRHFRHELASALAVLDPTNREIPDNLRDLVAYLIAAHHGKVRLSIRSMPNEIRPAEDRRFARGVWGGDVLPETDLGDGIAAPEVELSLEPMELGLCEEEPFTDQPSWAERMIRLRDRLGPFRLAYLEALLRAADWRASQSENHP